MLQIVPSAGRVKMVILYISSAHQLCHNYCNSLLMENMKLSNQWILLYWSIWFSLGCMYSQHHIWYYTYLWHHIWCYTHLWHHIWYHTHHIWPYTYLSQLILHLFISHLIFLSVCMTDCLTYSFTFAACYMSWGTPFLSISTFSPFSFMASNIIHKHNTEWI